MWIAGWMHHGPATYVHFSILVVCRITGNPIRVIHSGGSKGPGTGASLGLILRFLKSFLERVEFRRTDESRLSMARTTHLHLFHSWQPPSVGDVRLDP